MCGFAGIVSFNKTPGQAGLVTNASAQLLHRGPDASGQFQSPDHAVFLSHRRLCILDPSEAAAQPMDLNLRFQLVYNGELYNYLELKTQLQAKGFVFRSQSDTEVLMAAYSHYGKDCVHYFDGMFSFAIWDEQEKTLFAARDRFGEKPFFFCSENDRFVFASEIKAFWKMKVAKVVSSKMLYNFLTIGYTTNPTDPFATFYEHVQKLPPAYRLCLKFQTKEVTTEKYWHPYVAVNPAITENEAIEKFDTLFKNSIRKRLRSDVPIGTSLSGGLDSSSIVAFCSSETSSQYTHSCFTAVFPGFKNDETHFASLIAKQFGLNHHFATIHNPDVVMLMEKVAHCQDEPFSSASVLAQYKVFELAKQKGVTVLLDGQGADEMLAGYHKYFKWYWQELYKKGQLKHSGEVDAARALGINQTFGPKEKAFALFPHFAAALLQSRKSKSASANPDFAKDFSFENKRQFNYSLPAELSLNDALYFNSFVQGLEELLRLADRNSMANSVEVRLPFLQHELVEFLFTLPPQFKIRNGWTKWLLRKTVSNQLPEEVVWRKDKVGYEPPQQIWMQQAEVQEAIRHEKMRLFSNGILKKEAVEKPIRAGAAYTNSGNDWKYWSAGKLFS